MIFHRQEFYTGTGVEKLSRSFFEDAEDSTDIASSTQLPKISCTVNEKFDMLLVFIGELSIFEVCLDLNQEPLGVISTEKYVFEVNSIIGERNIGYISIPQCEDLCLRLLSRALCSLANEVVSFDCFSISSYNSINRLLPNSVLSIGHEIKSERFDAPNILQGLSAGLLNASCFFPEVKVNSFIVLVSNYLGRSDISESTCSAIEKYCPVSLNSEKLSLALAGFKRDPNVSSHNPMYL